MISGSKKILFVILAMLSSFLVVAQKLPNVQTNSITIPTTIKIDGKATEWGDELQAYNHSTNIYYTIANSNDELYLLIKANDITIVKKIISGGITFLIDKSDKRNTTGAVSITFPLLKVTTLSGLSHQLSDLSVARFDTVKNGKKIDSLVNSINNEAAKNIKEIKITGTKTITDTLISVYNEEEIKTAIFFDNKGALTYELSIPLKHLGLAINSGQFSYNIMLNGYAQHTENIRNNANSNYIVTSVPKGLMNNSGSDFNILNYPTDFWGKYTLVKK